MDEVSLNINIAHAYMQYIRMDVLLCSDKINSSSHFVVIHSQ